MNQEKNNDIKKPIGSLIITIAVIIVVIMVGTLAWLTYRSNDTAMVLTIGEIDGMTVTLKPYQVTAALTPTNDYTTQQYVNVTTVNKKTTSETFKLYYQVDSIDSALVDDGFKYTIVKSTNNWSSQTVVKTGDFSTASAGNNLEIYNESVPGNNTTYQYKVYLWIDSSDGNQSAMQGKIFKGELRAEIVKPYTVYTSNLFDVNATGGNLVWIGQTMPVGITAYNTPEAAITALETAYSNANSGATASLPFFLKHTVADGTLWCADEYDNGTATGNSFCIFPSQAACNSGVSEGEYDNITFTCVENTFTCGVTESYVGFTITSAMATANPGMTAGTYYLRGGDNGAAFLTNAKTIYDAFGGVVCSGDSNLPATYDSTYNPSPSYGFGCGVSGVRAYAYSDGTVGADNRAGWGCGVRGYGVSNCGVGVGDETP